MGACLAHGRRAERDAGRGGWERDRVARPRRTTIDDDCAATRADSRQRAGRPPAGRPRSPRWRCSADAYPRRSTSARRTPTRRTGRGTTCTRSRATATCARRCRTRSRSEVLTRRFCSRAWPTARRGRAADAGARRTRRACFLRVCARREQGWGGGLSARALAARASWRQRAPFRGNAHVNAPARWWMSTTSPFDMRSPHMNASRGRVDPRKRFVDSSK